MVVGVTAGSDMSRDDRKVKPESRRDTALRTVLRNGATRALAARARIGMTPEKSAHIAQMQQSIREDVRSRR